LFAFLMMLVGAPAHAQGTGMLCRFSVDLGPGSHFMDGGDLESMSVGLRVAGGSGFCYSL